MVKAVKYRIELFYLIILVYLGVLVSLGYAAYWIIIPLCIIIQLLIIKKFRNHQFIIVISLYLTLYLIYLIPYFYFGIRLSQYTERQVPEFYNKLAYLFLLFYSGILLVKKVSNSRINLASKVTIKSTKEKKILYCIGLVCLFILTLRQGQNVIGVENSYALYKENLENTNSLPLILTLYLILFIPIMGKKYKYVFVFLLVLISLFCVTRGMRMVLAPVGLVFFAFFFENRISTGKLMALFLLAFVMLLGVNALKMSVEFSIMDSLSEGDHDFILSHQADNLYAGSVGINLADNDIINFWDRIMLNIGYFLESVIPPAFLPVKMKYPHIIGYYVKTGGGGLFLTGAFLMWGYIGVFLFGYFLSKLICFAENDKRNKIFQLITLIICVFSPRWISYDFHVILRFSLIGTFLYLFFNEWKKYSCDKQYRVYGRR